MTSRYRSHLTRLLASSFCSLTHKRRLLAKLTRTEGRALLKILRRIVGEL